MSAILYNLTVTDHQGRVIHEVTHTSAHLLAADLPKIKAIAEDWLEEQALEQLNKNPENHEEN